MPTVEFTGSISSPAHSGVGVSTGCSASGVDVSLGFTFEPIIAEYADVQAMTFSFESSTWVHLPVACGFDTVELLALSLAEGSQPIEILLGHPPELQGSGGTFPTGFAGGELFDFSIGEVNGTPVVLSIAFTSAAQSAQQVANEINAAAALQGLAPVATVVGGQLLLAGAQPGAEWQLELLTANTTIGFPSSLPSITPGTGTAQEVDPLFLSTAETPGSDVWVKGGLATISLFAAGS